MATITTPDYGLLKGLADGANSFLTSYQTTKNLKHQQQMAEMLNGVQKDENGNLVYTPEKQQQMAAQQAGYKQQIEESTPGSDIAKASAQALSSNGYAVPEGLSYSEQKGLIEPLAVSKMKVDAARAGLQNRNEHQDIVIDKRLKSQQEGAAQKDWARQFGQSSPITQRLEGVSRINNLIKAGERGEIPTTREFLNRANAEVTAMEQGKANFALGSQERTEIESSAANIQSVLNKVFNERKGSDLSAALKDLKANMNDMSDSYMDQAERGASQLEEGAPEYGAAALKQKHGLLKDQYTKAFGHWGRQSPPAGGLLQGGGGDAEAATPSPAAAHPYSPQAIQWAKANLKDPRAIEILKRNGIQ